MGETYDVGVRVGSSSDDAALEQFNAHLNKVLQDSAKLSETLKALSESFKKEDDAAKTAADSTEKAGEKAKKAKEGFSEFAKEIGKSALELVGLNKAWEFIKDSFKGVMAEEKLMAGLTNAVKTLTGATEEEAEAAKEWVEATSLVAGKTKEDLVPALEKAVAATGNLGDAQALLDYALAASKKTGSDFTTVIDLTTIALQTGKVRGQDPYAFALRAIMNEGHSAKEAVEIFSDRISKSGAATETTAKQVDRAAISWGETKDKIGELAAALFDTLGPSIKFIGTLVGGLIALLGGMGQSVAAQLVLIQNLAGVSMDLVKGNFRQAGQEAKGALGQYKQMLTDATTDFKRTVSEYEDLWDLSKAKAAKKATQAPGSLSDALDKIKGRPEKGGGKDKESKAEQDLAKAIMEVRDAEVAEAKAALESAQSTKQKEAAIWNLFKALEKQKQAEQDALDVEKKMALASAKSTDERAKIEETFRLKQIALDKKFAKEEEKIWEGIQKDKLADEKELTAMIAKFANEQTKIKEAALKRQLDNEKKYNALTLKGEKKANADELKILRAELVKELFMEETSAKRRIEIARNLGKLDVEIARATATEKRQLYADAASQMISLAQGAFGKNKGLAIASALISTYSSATKAYDAMASIPYVGPALGAIAAALAVVAGLKNVQQIRKSQPEGESGFDNPEHDAMAGWAGRKWAEDWVNLTSAGFSGRLTTLMGSGAGARQTMQNITNRTTNGPRVNINASLTALSGSHGKRVIEDLARKIDRAAPAVDRLRLSQPRVKRGSARRVNQ